MVKEKKEPRAICSISLPMSLLSKINKAAAKQKLSFSAFVRGVLEKALIA